MRNIVKILTILLIFINLPQAQAGKLGDWIANISDYNEAKIRMFNLAQGFVGIEACNSRYFNSRKKLGTVIVHTKCYISGKYLSSYNDRYKKKTELLSDQLNKYFADIRSDDNLHFSRREEDKLAGFIWRLVEIFKNEQAITAAAIKEKESQNNEYEITINNSDENNVGEVTHDPDEIVIENSDGEVTSDHNETLMDSNFGSDETTQLISPIS